MSASIHKVAVIGAGTMGAAIAAHAANAGLPVLLLDVTPKELTPDEEKRGLGLDHPAVKNRVVRQCFERAQNLRPASFMSQEAVRLVELGNLDDDFERLAVADWIVEAIIEKLEPKRQLLERLDAVRRPGSIVTTNTSGLPVASIVEGRSDDLRRHFFGTHFFNPPRYMKLLEVIRGQEADPQAVERFADFARKKLGKGVVFCKDTPNFIGNRILSVHGSFLMDWALKHGYRFEEVDAVAGPLLGRPKTASFRLQDLVGIDVAYYVSQNLYDLIPDDPHREVLRSPRLMKLIGEELVGQGILGNKTGSGFYRKTKKDGKTVFEVLDPETLEYGPQREVDFPSLAALREIREPRERLRALLFEPRFDADRGALLARATIAHFLAYAAAVAPEIAYDLASVDRAIRWGFSYEWGPFELWDLLGLERGAQLIRDEGFTVAPWVEDVLAASRESFYSYADGKPTGYWDWSAKGERELERDPRHVEVADLHRAGKKLAGNESASLLDLGQEVLLLEFHSKANALDAGIVEMMEKAATWLEVAGWKGLVIGNDGANFSLGANLKMLVGAAEKGGPKAIAEAVTAMQSALSRLRALPKPVVAAVHGRALGGGAEVAMGAHRVVAHAESYLGLVEVGVGLLPAGGGLKELVRRVLSPTMEGEHADPLPVVQSLLETVAMAKVSTSAEEAREMGFLASGDRVVMNRDHLLYEARREVLEMAEDFTVPAPARLYAGGRDLLAALDMAVWSLRQAGFASEHDALIASKIARVLTGGDASAPQWLGEEPFLALERQGFVELTATEKTRQRIRHLLETGKPLRN